MFEPEVLQRPSLKVAAVVPDHLRRTIGVGQRFFGFLVCELALLEAFPGELFAELGQADPLGRAPLGLLCVARSKEHIDPVSAGLVPIQPRPEDSIAPVVFVDEVHGLLEHHPFGLWGNLQIRGELDEGMKSELAGPGIALGSGHMSLVALGQVQIVAVGAVNQRIDLADTAALSCKVQPFFVVLHCAHGRCVQSVGAHRARLAHGISPLGFFLQKRNPLSLLGPSPYGVSQKSGRGKTLRTLSGLQPARSDDLAMPPHGRRKPHPTIAPHKAGVG